MAGSSKLYLIDEDGRPVGDHIANAVERLERKIMRQYGRACDPAILSNEIEAAARNTARHERKHGPLRNVTAFVWKTINNLVISELRSQPKEELADSATLERWAGAAQEAGPEQIHNYVLAREVFESMSQRDQQICWLTCQGVPAKEIGKTLGMSEQNVWTTLSRIRKATQKALLNKWPQRCE